MPKSILIFINDIHPFNSYILFSVIVIMIIFTLFKEQPFSTAQQKKYLSACQSKELNFTGKRKRNMRASSDNNKDNKDKDNKVKKWVISVSIVIGVVIVVSVIYLLYFQDPVQLFDQLVTFTKKVNDIQKNFYPTNKEIENFKYLYQLFKIAILNNPLTEAQISMVLNKHKVNGTYSMVIDSIERYIK